MENNSGSLSKDALRMQQLAGIVVSENKVPIQSILKEHSEPLNELWQNKLQSQYHNYDEFLAYDEIYGLTKRLGYEDAKMLWDQNPTITGSSDPADFKIVKDAPFKNRRMSSSLSEGFGDRVAIGDLDDSKVNTAILNYITRSFHVINPAVVRKINDEIGQIYFDYNTREIEKDCESIEEISRILGISNTKSFITLAGFIQNELKKALPNTEKEESLSETRETTKIGKVIVTEGRNAAGEKTWRIDDLKGVVESFPQSKYSKEQAIAVFEENHAEKTSAYDKEIGYEKNINEEIEKINKEKYQPGQLSININQHSTFDNRKKDIVVRNGSNMFVLSESIAEKYKVGEPVEVRNQHGKKYSIKKKIKVIAEVNMLNKNIAAESQVLSENINGNKKEEIVTAAEVNALAEEISKVNKRLDFRNPLFSGKSEPLLESLLSGMRARQLDVDSINENKHIDFAEETESSKIDRLLNYKTMSEVILESENIVEIDSLFNDLSSALSKYGWTVQKLPDNSGFELFNRKNSKVCTAKLNTGKGGQYTFLNNSGQKLSTGRGQIGISAEKVATGYFYATAGPNL